MASKLDQHQVIQSVYNDAEEALDVSIVAGSLSAEVSFNYNGATTEPTFVAASPTDNRGSPVVLLAGQALAPVAVGTGAASATTLRVVLASGETYNINNISGTISLPTGASTEATLSALNTKVPSQGQALMAASVPVVIASNQSAIPASQSGTWNINNISGTVSLPTGAATESTLSTVASRLADRTVVDFLDTPLLDATTIAGSAGVFLEVVASTASAVKSVYVMDTSGAYLGWYTGAAAAEALAFITGPGQDQPISVTISAGTRISVRSMESSAPTGGYVAVNFIG